MQRNARCVRPRAWAGSVSFFFFQAEDGIRDLTVTGVQTCALPISIAVFIGRISDARLIGPVAGEIVAACDPVLVSELVVDSARIAIVALPRRRVVEIGRASCRERV